MRCTIVITAIIEMRIEMSDFGVTIATDPH